MIATVENYAFAANLSEATLLQTVAEMARARSLESMAAFLDFLDASPAKSGPLFAGNVSTSLKLREQPKDDPQYVENGITSLDLPASDLLVMVLAPAEQRFAVSDDPESRELGIQDVQRLSPGEEAYLWRMANMADDMPDPEWIDDLGLSLVQNLNDPVALEKFTDEFSLTTEGRRTYRHFMSGRSSNETSLAEQALQHGNLAIVPHLVHLLDRDSAAEVLKHFIYEQADQNESLRLMDLAVRQQPSTAIAIVDALEEKLGIEEIAELRIRVMEAHMRHSINHSSGVNAPALLEMIGPTQEHRDAVEMLCRIHTGKNLAMTIVASHTHELMPLISAGLTILPQSEPSRAQAEIRNAIDDRSRTIAGQHDADRLKKTILFMIERGQTLSITQDNQSALRCLAKTTPSEDRSAKLAVLLALGDDPQKKDYQGKIPSAHLKPAMRKEWDSVCKSFAARRAAHSLLDEMDAEPAPAKVSP